MLRDVSSNPRAQASKSVSLVSQARSEACNPGASACTRSQSILWSALVFTGWLLLLQTQPSSAEKISENVPEKTAERLAEKIAAKGTGSSQKAINDPRFHKQLLKIAAEYEKYSKVDDMMRWAPGLCMIPPPPKARLSHSKDIDTHGRKLYYLYARHRNAYVNNEKNTAGQVVVKEAWMLPTAADIKAVEDQIEEAKRARQAVPMFKPDPLGPKSGLYIMFKAESKNDTDEGWVYGTVMPDGKTVTAAGRVESCMGCHVSAPHGRLFGLQK